MLDSVALAARGHAYIKSTNRREYRKWFVAQGVAATLANAMPNWALAKAYNDTTDAKLNLLRSGQRFWKPADEIVNDVEPLQHDVTPSTEPEIVQTIAPKTDNADAVQDAIKTLFTLIGQTSKGGIDADAVRQIMRDEMPSLIPTVRVEVARGDAIKITENALRHKQFKDVLSWVAIRESVVMVGPAGSGKTTIAEHCAEALEKNFHTTGQLDSSFILSGYKDGNGTYHSTAFRHAFEHGGIFIADEMDGWDSNALLWVNGALANGYATFPDSPHPVKRHDDFVFIACCNTWGNGADREYVGRNQLDAATLDRFAFIHIEYDEKLERALADNETWVDRVQAVRRAVTSEKIRHIVSPRASIKGAKALAAGIAQHKVEAALLWKGLDKDVIRRIENRVAA